MARKDKSFDKQIKADEKKAKPATKAADAVGLGVLVKVQFKIGYLALIDEGVDIPKGFVKCCASALQTANISSGVVIASHTDYLKRLIDVFKATPETRELVEEKWIDSRVKALSKEMETQQKEITAAQRQTAREKLGIFANEAADAAPEREEEQQNKDGPSKSAWL